MRRQGSGIRCTTRSWCEPMDWRNYSSHLAGSAIDSEGRKSLGYLRSSVAQAFDSFITFSVSSFLAFQQSIVCKPMGNQEREFWRRCTGRKHVVCVCCVAFVSTLACWVRSHVSSFIWSWPCPKEPSVWYLSINAWPVRSEWQGWWLYDTTLLPC